MTVILKKNQPEKTTPVSPPTHQTSPVLVMPIGNKNLGVPRNIQFGHWTDKGQKFMETGTTNHYSLELVADEHQVLHGRQRGGLVLAGD